jgi:hypothetical protein
LFVDWIASECGIGPASDLTKRALLIERHSTPEILVHGLAVASDVDKLFDTHLCCIVLAWSIMNVIAQILHASGRRCLFRDEFDALI